MSYGYDYRGLDAEQMADRRGAMADVDGKDNMWPKVCHIEEFPDTSRLVWWCWKNGKVVGPSVWDGHLRRRREGIRAL